MKNITHEFHIEGVHCKSCAMFVEKELLDLSYVDSVKINFHKKTVIISGDFEGIPQENLANDFSVLLSDKGYSFSVYKNNYKNNLSDFKKAIPLSLGFIFIFFFLQKLGLINFVNTGKISFGAIFLIGLVASISSCMAVVGGLLLSMSAIFSKGENGSRPEIMFHIGRLLSFFLLGGVIGILGSAFSLGNSFSIWSGVMVAVIMFMVGVHLLDFHFFKRFQPTMPKFISRNVFRVSKINHTITPFLVGIVTFFLPCGFTQSMQIYALTTGNFLDGATIMFSFALGTLPVLALVSFGSLKISKSAWSGVFFKTAGLIVIAFAIFGILNSLVIAGIISPIFHF